MVEEVRITDCSIISDERGAIFHMIRSDDLVHKQLGGIYFSKGYQGFLKGWHIRRRAILDFAVSGTMIKLVPYDDKAASPTKGEIMDLFIGEENYKLVTIPSKTRNGFKVVGTKVAIMANCATEPYDPKETGGANPLKVKAIMT